MRAMTEAEARAVQSPRIAFELNGRAVSAAPGETLIQVCDREGVDVPRLCYKDGLEPAGNCRACVVEIAGERVLAPSCCRAPAAGMKVTTDSERARKSQKLVLELLQSDMPEKAHTRRSELDQWASALEVGKPRFPAREAVASDLSAVMRDASICGLGQAAPNPVDCVVKYFAHELTDQ